MTEREQILSAIVANLQLDPRLEEAMAEIAQLKQANAHLWKALSYAEAALADIGDAEREPSDDLRWCENRAAEALPKVRRSLSKNA